MGRVNYVMGGAGRVFLYVPNLIGYARIVGMLASFCFAFDRPWLFLGCYWLSFMLDAADGYAARLLGGVCMLNEGFYVALYALHFFADVTLLRTAVYVCAPFFALKQYINVVQLVN